MSLEPIGAATLLLGLLCLAFGRHAIAMALVVTTLFGAAAAMFLAGANIQPAHLFIAFALFGILSHRREAAAAIRSLRPPEPGFWLACLLLYGLAGALLLPRILAGATDIVPLGSSQYGDTGSTVPLGPVSSNLTQSVYMTANLACFCLIVATASSRRGFEAVTRGLLWFCVGNVLFALLDLSTYLSGTQGLLDFMRNARYTLHHEEEVYGLKRIVGSYTEASSFARSTLGAFGFTATLWLCGIRPRLTGPLAVASLLLAVLSTSSTGLAGAAPMLALLYVTAILRSGLLPDARRSAGIVLLVPPIAAMAAIVLVMSSDLAAIVHEYVDILILSKGGSDSGVERSSWNAVALLNFTETWGLGTGLGTVRTSGLAFALLANVGLAGTLFYAIFIATAFLRRPGRARSFASDVRLSACNACLGLFVGDLMVGPSVDQGLLFHVLIGLACATPEREVVPPSLANPTAGALA